MPCGRRHADRFPCPLLADARHCRLTLLAMGLIPGASDTESSQSAQSQATWQAVITVQEQGHGVHQRPSARAGLQESPQNASMRRRRRQ